MKYASLQPSRFRRVSSFLRFPISYRLCTNSLLKVYLSIEQGTRLSLSQFHTNARRGYTDDLEIFSQATINLNIFPCIRNFAFVASSVLIPTRDVLVLFLSSLFSCSILTRCPRSFDVSIGFLDEASCVDPSSRSYFGASLDSILLCFLLKDHWSDT